MENSYLSEQFGVAGLVLRIATRPPGRFFANGLIMALISFFLAGALLLGQGIEEGAARGVGRLGADLMVVPKGTGVTSGAKLFGGVPVSSALPEGIEGRVAAMAGISRVASQYIFSSAADSCCEMGDILLVGFDPSLDFTVLPWLRPGVSLSGKKEQILAGWRVMKAPGASMRFFNQTFTLAARLEKSGGRWFDTALFIPLDGLAAMERSSRNGGKPLNVPWGKPSILLVRLESSIEPRQMALALERQYPGIQTLTITEPLRENRFLMERLGRGQRPLCATAWLIALLSGGAFQFLCIRARRSSMGLLHFLGCGKGLLSIVFGMEIFVLSLAGMVAGSLGAFYALRLSGPYLVMATGVPLLPGWISQAASGLPMSFLTFAGAMYVESVIIVLLMLRSEPADMLSSSLPH
jgi:putative ABC transport system permease protein